MHIKGALNFRLGELKPSNKQLNLNQPKVNALEITYRPNSAFSVSICFTGNTGLVEPAGRRRRPTQTSIWSEEEVPKTVASQSWKLVLAIVEPESGWRRLLAVQSVNSDRFPLELGRRAILIQLKDFGRPQGSNIRALPRDKHEYMAAVLVFVVPPGRNSVLDCQFRCFLEWYL